jgi:hypothetical protein
MLKYKTLIVGNNVKRTINPNYRIALKLCALETLFVPGV